MSCDCNLTLTLYALQDLSSFAMPLLESDSASAPVDVEDGFRPRSSSGTLKNFFRKRHKSGEIDKNPVSPAPSNKTASPLNTPVQSSKMRHFIESFRPRSKSDAAAIPVARRRRGPAVVVAAGTDEPPAGMPSLIVGSVPGKDTPMSSLLASHSPGAPHEKGLSPEEFIEAFRERAYSDPKPRAKMAALAAKRASYRKVGVCIGGGGQDMQEMQRDLTCTWYST